MLDLVRFVPMLPVAKKLLATMSAEDLTTVAASFVGAEEAAEVAKAVLDNRNGSTEDLVSAVLATKAIQNRVNQGHHRNAEEANSIYCRCPDCGCAFETVIHQGS